MAVKRRYLDHNATTPLTKMARMALLESLEIFGNPSSVHTEGRAAKALLQKSRRQIADRLKANPDNVVFTSGASEAAMTLLTPFYHIGRSEVQFSHLYIGASEHPSIAEGGRFSKELISIIDVDQHGLIQQDKLKSLLIEHDKAKGLPLIAIQAANSETGVIQNIQEIASIVRDAGGTLIVDLVQYIDKYPIDINHFGGDFFILSAHKIGGPKGVGAFVSCGDLLMPSPLITAGGQEKGHRGGTEALPLIASFGAAMENCFTQEEIKKLIYLRNKLEDGLLKISHDVIIFGKNVQRLPNTTYFTVRGIKAETMQIGLDLAGFSVSAGSACSSGKVKQSKVLEAMGYHISNGAIRVSTGRCTTSKDIDDFLLIFAQIIGNKRQH
ncbi:MULTISPECIES: cysteine desulfurase family protein [unclassified Bartonella]|uniref:cysteine desulfurase family protein n=1 Tax=unclassified Bartonella TaxID=2645622 RepID=UPI00099A228F|nr:MULTISPECIES: cysteine desulfurase family protein [unclassified Bartonella]AQX18331.1 cysteine desulfurase [Bartonella sp. A1379B]AQX22845.1 cysteine desulfurase [Bartonella sp. 11B]AQX23864.1 cysteine desulfurase [Bartonella sp. 114]AQX25296.1 cysteine desulfurase [Bartonella sp. Coyote22sub2]